MVYTRFGSPIKRIEWFDEESGDCRIHLDRSRGGKSETVAMTIHSSEIKADGGINEILNAAETRRNPL